MLKTITLNQKAFYSKDCALSFEQAVCLSVLIELSKQRDMIMIDGKAYFKFTPDALIVAAPTLFFDRELAAYHFAGTITPAKINKARERAKNVFAALCGQGYLIYERVLSEDWERDAYAFTRKAYEFSPF